MEHALTRGLHPVSVQFLYLCRGKGGEKDLRWSQQVIIGTKRLQVGLPLNELTDRTNSGTLPIAINSSAVIGTGTLLGNAIFDKITVIKKITQIGAKIKTFEILE